MKEKILIIDDDREYISQIAEILEEEEGYSVGFTTDGYVAFDMLNAVTYDLIILDLNMPRISGMEVLKELKNTKTTRLIPVLMSTGDSSVEAVKKAIKLGADDYIVKPLDVDMFLDKIYVLLKIRSFVKRWGVLPK